MSETISRPSAHVSQRLSPIAPDPNGNPVEEPGATSGLRRASFLVAGCLFTALAIVGVFLPLVPTTPFLLVAAACFARSSPRLYRWLLSNRTFGPYIEQWRRERTIPSAAKHRAYVVVVVVFATSIAFVGLPWARLLLVAVGLALLVFLARLPTAEPPA